jgi:hypothetical protein
LVHHHHFQTRLEAQRAISEYINIFYNRQRLQATLSTCHQQSLISDGSLA